MNDAYMNALSQFSKKYCDQLFSELPKEVKTPCLQDNTPVKIPEDFPFQQEWALFIFYFTAFLKWQIQQSYDKSPRQPGEKPLFIFVTKKGYWLYRCIFQFLFLVKGAFSTDVFHWCEDFWRYEIEVKSDRFFTKLVDAEEYKNRRIFVFDDIAHTGASFERLAQTALLDGMQAGQYIVLAAAEELLINRPGVYACQQMQFHVLGELSIDEVYLFQTLGIPYVIDLPVLKIGLNNGLPGLDPDQIGFSSGRLEKDRFKALCSQCDLFHWRVVNTDYCINGKKITSCYFWSPEDPIAGKFKNLIQNLVIECSYREVEDGTGNKQFDVTFVPFAIMRSAKQLELMELFLAAYHDTSYCSDISRQFFSKNPNDPRLNTALYRSLVYYFSGYTAVCFSNLLSNFQIQLCFETDHFSEIWNQSFIDSARTIFPNSASCTTIQDVYRLNDTTLSPEYWMLADQPRSPVAGDMDMYLKVYEYFVETDQKGILPCSFENLEVSMAKKCGIPIHDVSFKENLTCALIQLLNQSAISNAILSNDESDYITRGFRPGENCVLLLPFDHPAIFCAIVAFYERCGGDALVYRRNYSYFEKNLLKFILDANFNYYIDWRGTQELLGYFREISELNIQIENRKYIADRLLNDVSNDATIAKELCAFVQSMVLL